MVLADRAATPFAGDFGFDVGLWWWRLVWSDYAAMVRGMGASMRSKARRWSGVGSASMGDFGVGGVVADLVAGQGGQVIEQAAEAA